MSMANFTASLISAHPGLNPEFLCGEKYMSYIIDLPKSIEFKHLSQEVADEEFAKRFDFNAFLGRFLQNPADAAGLITDKRRSVQHLMFNASDAVCIGGCPDLKHYFTEKEFVEIGNIYDIFLYGHLCNAKATGRLNMSDSVTLLTDFVTKADEAVSGNSIAADIRFGHDSALLNFLCMIGLKGFDTNVDLRDAVSCFNSSELMPMASNLQLVFYRSKRGGDVLVKVLYNEKETCLPGLGPGPYYRWKDVRS